MSNHKYMGNDNYGHPRSDFLAKLSNMSDKELRDACSEYIWLSAYANNNPRSDYHWQCDACFDECVNRGKKYIYEQEHSKLVAEVS